MQDSRVKCAIVAAEDDNKEHKIVLIEPTSGETEIHLLMRGVYRMLQDKKFRIKAIRLGGGQVN